MTPAPRYVCALVASVMLACTFTGAALAQELGISVEQTGCEGVDPRRIEQIVGLELASTFGTSEHGLALSAEIACRDQGIDISAQDPLTDKRVSRTLPALSSEEKDPERAIALATAQLFLASWLELLVAENQGPTPTGASPRTVEGAKLAASQTLEQPRRRGELAAFGGARLRALGELLPVTRVGLEGGGEVGSGFSLFGLAAFEYGRASRDLGTATVYGAWVGLGAAHRWPVSAPLSIELGVMASGGYALLKGKATGPDLRTGEVDGVTGELALFGGPVFYFGDILAAIDLQGGYTFRNPVGTVEGQDDVSIGGFWLGGVIRVGLRLD